MGVAILQGQARQRGADHGPRSSRPRPEASPAPASAEEATQLRQRFEEALGLLRSSASAPRSRRCGRGSARSARSSTSTTCPGTSSSAPPAPARRPRWSTPALRFPLADRLGREAVRGVGGTRNCDWWFTDEAVFLDTAGRYTTQESDREVDAAAWKSFLELLKKSRPRRPINGVLVTVSVDDLLQQSAAEREAHAQALRARVQELYEALGVRIPVYVLVTKSDLLAGFSEFFSTLGREERAQAWGFSLPVRQGGARPRAPVGRAPAAGAAPVRSAARAARGGARPDAARAALRLPPAVRPAARPPRRSSSTPPSRRRKFEAPLLLRGVYFTSGTQEGSPIDRVMGALARGLRPGAQAPARAAPERPELLPHAPPARGGVPRGRARRIRPALGAPPPVAPARRHRARAPSCWSSPPWRGGSATRTIALPRGGGGRSSARCRSR